MGGSWLAWRGWDCGCWGGLEVPWMKVSRGQINSPVRNQDLNVAPVG